MIRIENLAAVDGYSTVMGPSPLSTRLAARPSTIPFHLSGKYLVLSQAILLLLEGRVQFGIANMYCDQVIPSVDDYFIQSVCSMAAFCYCCVRATVALLYERHMLSIDF